VGHPRRDRDSLVRIDPTTNRIVATIDIPNPDYWNEVVVEGEMVWVAIGGPDVRSGDGIKTNVVRVVRIDPMTNEMVREPIESGYGMFGIGSGDGSVWVYDGFSDAITQIDAASGGIVRVIPVVDEGSSWGGDPGIDAADGFVWMAGGKVLNRIDLSSTWTQKPLSRPATTCSLVIEQMRCWARELGLKDSSSSPQPPAHSELSSGVRCLSWLRCLGRSDALRPPASEAVAT
jgi:hypothetical protein